MSLERASSLLEAVDPERRALAGGAASGALIAKPHSAAFRPGNVDGKGVDREKESNASIV
jgi:hypothetical protein